MLAGIAETICVRMSMYNTELPLPKGVVVPYSEMSVAENSFCFSETSQLPFMLLSIQNLAPLVNVAAMARSTD